MNCTICNNPKPTNSIKRCDECIRIANKLNVQHHRQMKIETEKARTFNHLMSKWVVTQ